MSTENSSAHDQKLEPPPLSQEAKAKELLEWPPKAWKDDFKVPPHYLYKMQNQLQGGICRLNTAPSLEKANEPEFEAKQEVAIFFSYRKSEVLPENGKINHEDYMVFPIPENRGLAKVALIHKASANFISETRKQFGNVILKFHCVPHPKEHSVFSIKTIYILPPGSEATTLTIAKDKACFSCGRLNALGTCKCETISFCSQMCRENALRLGQHTEEECTRRMIKVVTSTMKDARLLISDYKRIVDEDVKAAADMSKVDAERRERAQALLKAAKEAEEQSADLPRREDGSIVGREKIVKKEEAKAAPAKETAPAPQKQE